MLQKDLFGNTIAAHDVPDITFHYTDEKMVKRLISLIPFEDGDTALDAGSGKNKVWFGNLPLKEKYECELDDGVDYLREWNKKVDWVVGNPPYHIGKDFLEKSLDIADKGIAFLINLNGMNSFLLPQRLELAKEKGFAITKIHVVQDRRWFGRYFFIIYQKKKEGLVSWDLKSF